MERDPKGLYKLHKEGKMDNIVGINMASTKKSRYNN